jgi:hypothetical protein
MTRQEAIRKLEEEHYTVEPGQEFETDRMRPEDAWGVARCFFAVYGGYYPFDVYYIPERLIEENRSGNLFSVVARTAKGAIVGCAALYRSSAYSPRVYEFGQGTVLPEYRSTFAFYCLQDYILNEIAEQEEIDGIFGEAVCNHILSQRLSGIAGFVETGIEVGLMSPDAYGYEEFPDDRISTVLGFKTIRDRKQPVYVPALYGTELEYILSGSDVSRTVTGAESAPPATLESGIASQFFDLALVARFNIYRAAQDLPQRLTSFEEQAEQRGMRVRQFFVNLGEPGCGWAAERLREKGYFFGGFLPRWFDSDGLLLQKVDPLPKPASLKLYSDRSRRILDMIRGDIRSNESCLRTPEW